MITKHVYDIDWCMALKAIAIVGLVFCLIIAGIVWLAIKIGTPPRV